VQILNGLTFSQVICNQQLWNPWACVDAKQLTGKHNAVGSFEPFTRTTEVRLVPAEEAVGDKRRQFAARFENCLTDLPAAASPF
jgi:hypothetical protein